MPNYIWQLRYEAALIETDPSLLSTHLKKTREAMIKRLKVLAIYEHETAREEYQAIQDAEMQLKVLERALARNELPR